MIWSFPWNPPQSEKIKLKSCRNLIEYYLGSILEKLTLDQLSVNLYKGTGTVSDITLDCDALNKMGTEENWPMKIVKGHMEDITVKVPWSSGSNEDPLFKINGLSLTMQPKVRIEPVKSFMKWALSNWAKWSSPKQLLKNNMKQDKQETHTEQGAEMFADSIDTILRRLKLKLENTKLRIEYFPAYINRGVALDIHINNIDCYDETVPNLIPIGRDPNDTRTYVLNNCYKKKVKIQGVTLYTEEFLIKRDSINPIHNSLKDDWPASRIYANSRRIFKKHLSHENDSEMKIDIKTNPVKKFNTENKMSSNEELHTTGPIMFALLNGQQELTLTLKHSDHTESPAIQAETFGPFIVMLSSKQLESLIEILNSLKVQNTVYDRNISKPERVPKYIDDNYTEADLLNLFIMH